MWKLLFTKGKAALRYGVHCDFAGLGATMVKAVFHKNQRVFVAPVGTWATVERVIPHWVKGIEEPLRVYYDCGLGRDFDASELAPERPTADIMDAANESWAVFRRENRWQSAEDSAHHPAPGTHPVIVTAENARGGWRVPGAEYDLAPERYEAQARVMAAAPRLLRLAKTLVELSSEFEDEIPLAVHEQARVAARILADVQNAAATMSQSLVIEENTVDAPAVSRAAAPRSRIAAAAPAAAALSAAGPAFGRQEPRPAEPFVSPALRRPQAPR